jgi:hypothetical protein
MAKKRQVERASVGSWAGDGEIEIGAKRSGNAWLDQVIIGLFVVVPDVIGYLVISALTGPGDIVCEATGCSPLPSHQIHVATIGLVLFIALTVLPVLIALLWRRAIIGVIVVQIVAGIIMIHSGVQQLDLAHAKRTELCHNVPTLLGNECR